MKSRIAKDGDTIYLVKYRPLISSPKGKLAAARHKIKPFVDGSCRREPDFECKFPSITALCRGNLFAPHLQKGTEVVYITTKNFYGKPYKHWRIVARLKVHKRFDSHSDAAAWYQKKCGALPNNCMVPGNDPLPLNQTSCGASNCARGCGGAAAALQQLDKHYQNRADKTPVFLACKAICKQLAFPAVLTDQDAKAIFRRRVRLNKVQSPIKISDAELKALEKLCQKLSPKKSSKVSNRHSSPV
jgi:hypothetical protein